jgi:CRP/FNR family transcriptional regulator, cyclic AMP receptor protein
MPSLDPPRGPFPREADPLAAVAAQSPSVATLAARGEVRRYRKGRLLIEEGELDDTLYIVLSGQLRAFSEGENGRMIVYGTYGAGEFVGEMSLDGGPRSASVEAIEATTCAVITRQALLQHIAEQPDFALELIAKVIRRARSATLTSKQLALNDVYGRLKQLLEAAAKPQPDGSLWIDRRLTHREMAQHVACSREMVSRVMKDLVTGGYAAVDGAGLRLRSRLPPRW